MLSDSQEVSTTDPSSEDQESSRQPPAEQLAWELPSTLELEEADEEDQREEQQAKEKGDRRGAGQGSREERRENRPAAPAYAWPPLPDSLKLPPPPQATYPDIPGPVGRIIESVTRVSGCSRPIAALGVLGALSALASWDWDVQTLAPSPRPLSLNVLGISESTWRKTTAWRMIWKPHLNADEEVEDSWKTARLDYEKAPAGERNHYARSRNASPKLIRGDASVEALRQRLYEGRPCQAQVSDEAGDVLKWAFGERQLPATFSFYNKCFDATEHFDDKTTVSREVTVRRYRHQVALAGQGDVMMRIVNHRAAANGFIGRVLIAKDDSRPPRLPDPTKDDRENLHQYNEAVMAHRRRQDQGMHLAATEWPNPMVLRLDPDATRYLQSFNDEMEVETDRLHASQALHERTFAGRAAELAARLAGVLSAAEWYIRHPDEKPSAEDAHPGLQQVQTACEVVGFHQGELGRILAIAGGNEVSDSASRVLEWLREKLQAKRDGGTAPHINEHGHVALTRLVNDRVRSGPLRNPEFRKRVITALENEVLIAPVQGRRGWHHPHPDL